MKIRTDFVTNSSSSSFLVAFSSTDNMENEVNEALKWYSHIIREIVVNDVKRAKSFTKKEIMEAVENSVPVYNEWGLDHFDNVSDTKLASILREIWYNAEWDIQDDIRYDGRTYKEMEEYIRSEEGRAAIMDRYKRFFHLFDDYADNAVFVEIKYADDCDPYSML